MPEEVAATDLCLEPVGLRGGGEIGAPVISGNGPVLIGRARECDVCLPDPSVSRRHTSLVRRDDRWFVVDLGGRHGTTLNGVKLDPEKPAVAAEGDFVGIGPYTFRFVVGVPRPTTLARTQHDLDADTIVERVPEKEIGSLAQRRLALLIDGASMIHKSQDEQALAEAILQLALAGTGYPRAAVIRPAGSADEVEVIASQDVKAVKGEFSFSTSLLREASSGQIARLTKRSDHQLGQSIERLGITGALCAPIVLDASVVGYVYLDSRGDEQAGYADAAGFCHAVARLAGLALSNLKRAELQQRQNRLEEDLRGAREAQAFLCPKGEGVFGRLRYAVESFPGRFVAGDLFDIFAIDDRRVAICFGDVTGQGATAAILMAAVLSHLRAALARYGEPTQAVKDVNRYITESSPAHMFCSLWVGVFDGSTGVLSYVDAGHGHWFIRRNSRPIEHAPKPGGLLVGIEGEYPYEPLDLALGARDRIVLYSDGIIEQVSPDGEAFENARALEVLQTTGSVAEDVASIFKALKEFAVSALDDDTTVASIEVMD